MPHSHHHPCLTLSAPLLLACLLALAAWAGPACALEDGPAVPAGRPGYLKVPGLTVGEIEAIERVKRERGSFVLAGERSVELFREADGEFRGASALLCRWLTGFFGIPFEPAIMEFGDMMEGLEKGTVDFTAELAATPARRERFSMTGPVTERTVRYLRLPGARSLSEIAVSRPLRYGRLEGDASFERALAGLQGPFTVRTIGDTAEVWELLASGDIDAFVCEAPYEATFDPFGEVTTEDLLPLVTSPVSLSARDPELAPLIGAVQRLLDSEGEGFFAGLYREGRLQYARHRFLTSLDETETAWLTGRLSGGPGGEAIPLRAGLEGDNYPMSFWNEQEGEFQGVAPDILREVEALTGLKFESAFPEPVPWPAIYGALERGEIEIVSDLSRTPSREGRFLWPDLPYMTSQFALLSLIPFPDQELADVKFLRVGLPEATSYAEAFRRWFPAHGGTVLYPGYYQAFEGLERGEVDLVMGSDTELLSMNIFRERPYFKVNLSLDRRNDSYFGVAGGQEILRSVLSKALRRIDTEAAVWRWRSRVFDFRGAMIRARTPFMVAGLALLLCVVALLAAMVARSRREGRVLEEAVAARTAELEWQIEIAEHASKAKSDFLARTSHEIRTPMNAIIGFSELAHRELGQPACGGEGGAAAGGGGKVLEYIQGIRSAGASLLVIINDILDFSKIESGGLDLRNERYRPSSLLNDVITLIRVRLSGKPVALATDISPDIPAALFGDAGRVRQILLNLLSNAVKYTESGWIRLAARAVRVVTAGGGAGDGGDGALGEAELQFDVEDSGVGIRPEDMGRLFGEFTRLDGKRNSGVEGTGLGLAIARSLARAMGGDIEAESAYGEGSTFRVTMRQAVCDWAPMGRLADEHEGEPEPQPVSFTAPGAELLVVDDYRTNLIVAEGLLAPYGMRLTFAAGGAEAVRLASERRFDLIFMDHMMPGMDGVEACGEIRSLPEGGSVPVVAMTANAVVGMREMYLASGFSDFLSKPIDTFSLDACLSRWIPLYLRGPAPGRAGPAGGGRGAAGDRSGQAERRSLPDRRQDSVEGEDPDRREGMDRRLGADRRAWKDGSHQAALAAAGAGPAEDPLSIDGVDTVAGEHRAGGRERYLSYLEAFRGDAGRTAEAIAAIPDAGGLRDFTKAVHGLKGGLAAIGARPLYYWAAALEAAGRAGDLGLVVVGLPPFRERLGQLLARIDQIVPQAPREDVELAGRIAGLREAIRRRDIQDADRMILLVRESCGRELAPALDSIVDDILANDYDKALEDASALAAAGHSRA